MTKSDQNLMDRLIEIIGDKNPLHRKFIAGAGDMLLSKEKEDLLAYIQYCAKENLTLDNIASCYDLVVRDTAREQMYFRRHGKYRHSTFQEVASSVYGDDNYMRQYMVGLALTAFLWPNHVAINRFIGEHLEKVKSAGSYLDIGPGHGFYMMKAMRVLRHCSYVGVDISSTSVALTKRILGSSFFGDFGNYSIHQSDFLSWDTRDRYDVIVMGEVLEHVEDPERLLRKINEVASDEAHVFLTTCANAPEIDHIYLYRSVCEVDQQILDAGFLTRDRLIVPYQGKNLSECEKDGLPINVAYVLAKDV
jgi:2-polyprenyl-3-methyl-5-hydroxy-6-metoxy-1,4-benzoquinol methylase